jgi:hypothetical protein
VATIYVSSTFLDLEVCRKKTYDVLRKMQHNPMAMEDYVATDERPVEKCLRDVANCDLYLGIAARRYGYVPEADNPKGHSVTHLEYDRAKSLDKPRLLFLLDDDAPWPPEQIDTDSASPGIAVMRAEWKQDRLCSRFTTADDLATQVAVAAALHFAESTTAQQSNSLASLVKDVELATVGEADVGTSAYNDIAGQIYAALWEAKPTTILRIDLGTGWWSTRLLLLAALTLDFTQIKQFVFLNGDVFEGMASPLDIRRALSKADRKLVAAYEASVNDDVVKTISSFRDEMARVTGNLNWERDTKQMVTAKGLKAWGVDLSAETIQAGSLSAAWLLRLLEHTSPFVALLHGQVLERVLDRQALSSSLARALMTDQLERALPPA